MKIVNICVSKLNEKGMEYLKDCLEDFEGSDLDDLYSYLLKLEDTEIIVSSDEDLNDESGFILRVINDACHDSQAFELSYVMSEEHGKKLVMDIHRLNSEKHEYLKELFDLPDYYGENLDALYDCLSELDDTEVIVFNMEDLSEFSLDVIRVMDDISEEFHNLKLSYEYDENL